MKIYRKKELNGLIQLLIKIQKEIKKDDNEQITNSDLKFIRELYQIVFNYYYYREKKNPFIKD